MIRRPPRSTRTYTRFPYTTLFRSLEAARVLPDDMLGPFLLVARAAREGAPCPSDEAIAASYGTASLGRARRLLQYIESRDLIVSRVDLSGKQIGRAHV